MHAVISEPLTPEVLRFGDIPFPPDQIVPADVALVFGMNQPHRPVQHAIDLWRRGHVGQLLLTGGYNSRLGAVEAEVMADIALAQGLPESALLIEPCSTHTDQNAKFSARLLAAQYPAPRLLIVTIHFHLRRARLAVERWHGKAAIHGWSSYPSLHYNADNWHQSAHGLRDVAEEFEKIHRYYPELARNP